MDSDQPPSPDRHARLLLAALLVAALTIAEIAPTVSVVAIAPTVDDSASPTSSGGSEITVPGQQPVRRLVDRHRPRVGAHGGSVMSTAGTDAPAPDQTENTPPPLRGPPPRPI